MHISYVDVRARAPWILVHAAAALIFFHLPTPPTVSAQDILIFRPVNNSLSVVKTERITFEVEIEAFTAIKEVKINGEAQQVPSANSAVVRKPVKLKVGKKSWWR